MSEYLQRYWGSDNGRQGWFPFLNEELFETPESSKSQGSWGWIFGSIYCTLQLYPCAPIGFIYGIFTYISGYGIFPFSIQQLSPNHCHRTTRLRIKADDLEELILRTELPCLGGRNFRTPTSRRETYLLTFRNPAITSWDGKYPMIYKVFHTPSWCKISSMNSSLGSPPKGNFCEFVPFFLVPGEQVNL